MTDSPAGVAETVRRTTAGEVTARSRSSRPRWTGSRPPTRSSTRSPSCSPTGARPRPTRATTLLASGGTPGPAARRTGRDQGGDRRRRHGDDVRRRGQLARPAAADAEVVRRLRGGRRGRGRQDDDAGVRRVPLHRVGLARGHPQPVGPDPHARRLQRRYGGRGRRGHGAGRPRRRRRRLDPDPQRLLRAVRAQAAARPGHHRPAAAPVVGARHRRPAHPQRARQRASSTTSSAATSTATSTAAGGDRVVRRGRRPRARPAADRLVARSRSTLGRPAGPGPRARRRGDRAAARRPRPRRRRDRPALPRPDRRRSCRSSSPGSAPSPTLVEHYDRLERRTRQTYRMGSWVHAAGASTGRSRRPRRCRRRPTGSSTTCDVLLTPTIAHRPPKVGVLDGTRHRRRPRSRAMPAIAYVALWNVAGNPAASVPVRARPPTGCRPRSSWSAATDDEATLLSLSAQLERARPWPLVAGGYGRIVVSAIEVHDLAMAYGELKAVDGVELRGRRGRVLRHPRAQRRRQDHDAGDDRGPAQAGRRHDHGARPVAVAAQRRRCCRGSASSSRPRRSSSG